MNSGYLYRNVYEEYIKANKCDDEIDYISGMATARFMNSISNDKRYKLKDFYDSAKIDCARNRVVAYPEFQASFCRVP